MAGAVGPPWILLLHAAHWHVRIFETITFFSRPLCRPGNGFGFGCYTSILAPIGMHVVATRFGCYTSILAPIGMHVVATRFGCYTSILAPIGMHVVATRFGCYTSILAPIGMHVVATRPMWLGL